MRIIFSFILFTYSSAILAQLNTTIVGNAFDQGGNCFVITPNIQSQSGGVWFNNPIDFADDFSISYQNNFGVNDANGADGMAMVFKGNSNVEIGDVGGGVGYGGLRPSLVIEFDTWQNTDLGDPTWDHIAIIRDGEPNHNNTFTSLTDIIEASSTSLNIEDGLNHDIRIEWIADIQTLSVYFDCVLRTSLTLDIKDDVFSGDNTIFFGFVGSTGGASNLHQVCFNDVTFVDNLILQDQTICLGESIMFDATVPNGVAYTWTPTTGVSNSSIANPVFTPNITTTYTVMIENVCGETRPETVTITVNPILITPTFNQVPPICNGDTMLPLPTVSNEGIAGTWSPAIDNTVTTEYTFTPNPRECGTTQTMTIVVNENPNFILQDEYFLCFNAEGSIEDQVTIDTGLTTPNYNFTWLLNNVPLPGENEGRLMPFTEGTYEVRVQNSISSCETNNTTLVIGLVEPEFDINVTSDVFLDNQIIEIFPISNGVFEYKLDNGTWVDNPIFENVAIGEHTVYVKDIRGCIESSQTIFVIGYPKFFTPNGDGTNETWNIKAPTGPNNFLTSAEIFVYNRYGKLLKQLNPIGEGWTGLYNGKTMPADDYWFVINYFEPNSGERKQFTGHFTLKR
jgi:gliding motility-associated-like protein